MTTVLDISADPRRLRGRGALSNDAGRYEPHARVLHDDGWDGGDAAPSMIAAEPVAEVMETAA